MPTLKQATKPPDNLSNMSLVTQPSSAAQPIPSPNPNSMPNYEALSLAPAPAILSTDIDRQRQFYRQGVSSYRISPLPSKANQQINASARSIVTQVISQVAAATPPSSDVESIFTNVQSVTQYVVQVSDRVKLVSMNNNAGGTVVLPGGTITKGTFEHAVTNSGNSATASVSGTPYTGGGIALLYAAADNAGTLQNPLTFAPGIWTKLHGPGGGDEQLYTTVMPSSATAISPSATVSPSAGWVTTLAFFQNTTAVSLVQTASGGGGGLGNGSFPIVFGSNITKGNSIIVFITAASYTFGASGYPTPSVPTDTQGNTYKLIGHVIEDLGTAPGNFSPQTWIWVAENAVGGANTTTVVLSGGSLGGSISANIYGYELALTGASTSTGFDNGWYCYIENTGSGTFNVVSAAQIDGVSAATIALGPNSGIIAAFDGTNWFTERGAGSSGTSPQNTPAISHEVITAYNSTTGVFTQAQLSQGDILAGAVANGSTATTQAAGDNTTQLATDAFVTTAVQNIISGTTPADGMRHGDSVWWADAAFFELRDDFIFYSTATISNSTAVLSPIGELGWELFGSVAASQNLGGNPPHAGIIRWGNLSTSNGYGGLLINGLQDGGTAWLNNKALALLENPGWHSSWVFKFTGDMGASSNSKSTFNKKSFYCGYSGSPVLAVGPATSNSRTANSARPDFFIGVRYDTSTTPQAWGVGSVAAASGGTTVYTPNATSGYTGGVNTYKNCTVIIRNCTNAANNGTFTCTASSSTTITLNNAAGVVEVSPDLNSSMKITSLNITAVTANSPAAGQSTLTYANTNSVTSPGANGGYINQVFTGTGFTNVGNNVTATCIGSTATSIILNVAGVTETPTANAAFITPAFGGPDTNFQLEVVENPQYTTAIRHASQGTTSGTGIAPQIGNWYRLDISCIMAGQVVMTLTDENNVASASHTFTVPQVTCSSGSIAISTNANGMALLNITVDASSAHSNVPLIQTPPFTTGSIVTISGLTSALTPLNAAHILEEANTSAGSVGAYRMWFLSAANPNLSATQTATMVGYPSLTPICIWGDDDTGGSQAGNTYPFVVDIHVDLFTLAWNKAIASTANAPNSAKSRYW
jgi:hypothetical protein